MLPPYVRVLFWDTDTDHFNPIEFPRYAIARVLECGDREAIAWMRETFSEAEIVDVLRTERRLTRKSANFWAIIYHIPHEDVPALREEMPPPEAP